MSTVRVVSKCLGSIIWPTVYRIAGNFHQGSNAHVSECEHQGALRDATEPAYNAWLMGSCTPDFRIKLH